MKKYNSNIQAIKYIMAFLIIMYHDWCAFGYNNNTFLAPIIGSALTIFILITGYLKVESNNYNFLNIFLVVVGCLLINTFLFFVLRNFINMSIEPKTLFLGGRDWWYIWCFLLMQPFIPYLNIFLRRTNKYALLLIILLLVWMIVKMKFLHRYGQWFDPTNLFWMLIFYLVGGYIKLYFNLEGMKKVTFSFLTFGVTYISIMLYKIFINDNIAYFTNTWQTYLISVTLFMVLISVPSYQNKFIDYLGNLALYIYLFHYIIQIIYMTFVFKNNLIVIQNSILENFAIAIIIFISTSIAAIPISFGAEKFGKYSSIIIRKIWKYIYIK